jgi:hypothetical protein
MPETWRTDYSTPGWKPPTVRLDRETGEPKMLIEFCGTYKGDHEFKPGSKVCKCGRARK